MIFLTMLCLSGCTEPILDKPNIIIISLDTTRVDRLGAYGYHRDTSPNLDKLAEESVFYTRAISTSSWTLPAHASLFTGKFTSSHGAQYDKNGPFKLTSAISGPKDWDDLRARGISENEQTLAGSLKQAGYVTGGVVAGPWMKNIFGLSRGFDYYDDSKISTLNGRIAESVTGAAIKWLEKIKDNRFFLFLNYFDPHYPYNAPDGYKNKFSSANLKTLEKQGSRSHRKKTNDWYDGEISYMDAYIGKLLSRLKELGIYDNTWIIVIADHGERLGEDHNGYVAKHLNYGHGEYLFQQGIHIPLFMKYPKGEMSSRKVDMRIQTVDILPMIYERIGIPIPEDVQGTAELGLHPVISETTPLPQASPDGTWRAIYEGDYKFLWNIKGKHLLFNLKTDPGELKNLVNIEADRARDMKKQLEQYISSLPKPGPARPAADIDEKTKDALRSLGYIQ